MVTATIMNTDVRDNLKQMIALYTNVTTSQTTTSTSFTDLATGGPTLTAECSAAIVFITTQLTNNTDSTYSGMGIALSGANTESATDDKALFYEVNIGSVNFRGGRVVKYEGLAQGSATTFTAKYRVQAGTGTFQRRSMALLAIGPAV